MFCASKCVSVGDGASGRGVAVDAVGASAEDGNRLTGDFFGASEDEGRVATANSPSGDFATEFAIGDESDAFAGILATKIGELAEEILGCFV